MEQFKLVIALMNIEKLIAVSWKCSQWIQVVHKKQSRVRGEKHEKGNSCVFVINVKIFVGIKAIPVKQIMPHKYKQSWKCKKPHETCFLWA